MGRVRDPQPVKLICGLIGGDADLLRRARQLLGKRVGAIDLESDLWPFTQTDYYAAEMGPDLKRCFVAFDRLVGPGVLPEIKIETNAIEMQIADEALDPHIVRPVNLDPGYVDPGKLVLATTKDRSHRVYLASGIYAEVTLHRVDNTWQPWPWTYPDYLQPEYHAFFERVRTRLIEQRRAAGEAP